MLPAVAVTVIGSPGKTEFGADRARQRNRWRGNNRAEMQDNSCAKPRRVDIGAAAVGARTKVGVHVLASLPGRGGWRDDGRRWRFVIQTSTDSQMPDPI